MLTVSEAVAVKVPYVAVILAVPAPTPVARPALPPPPGPPPFELVMLATFASDVVHETPVVSVLDVPSS